MSQRPNNGIGCLIAWIYLMLVSTALAPVIADAVVKATQSKLEDDRHD